MLQITVPGGEWFDESAERFIQLEPVELELEHSLFTLSKWEAVYEKPFLGPAPKTTEEIMGYLEAMTLTPKVPKQVFLRLSEENMREIDDYINRKMTATWFSDSSSGSKSNEVITAELIYYWMTVFKLPLEMEHWHLNRLFTIINVANVKNSKPKKMSAAEIARRNRELNAKRLAEMKTTG